MKHDKAIQRIGLEAGENPLVEIKGVEHYPLLLHQHKGTDKLDYAPMGYFDLISRK